MSGARSGQHPEENLKDRAGIPLDRPPWGGAYFEQQMVSWGDGLD